MSPDNHIETVVIQIQDLLQDNLDFIVIFGSFVTGNSHPRSDLDIGVWVSLPEEKHSEVFGNLLCLFDSSSTPRVDVTLLNMASLSLLFRVARDGKIVYARNDKVWPNFVEYVLSRYPDWNYYIEDYLNQSLEA